MQTRPRQDRAERTRSAILDAATDCLVAYGIGGTTMNRVQQLAGVSRGALTHHFNSMNDLLIAAIDAIAVQQSAEIAAALEASDDQHALDALARILHEMMHRPVFLAGLELWAAARTDPSLREALTLSARTSTRDLRDITANAFDPPLEAAAASIAFDGTMSLLRGLALGSVIRERPEREQQILRLWLEQFARPKSADLRRTSVPDQVGFGTEVRRERD